MQICQASAPATNNENLCCDLLGHTLGAITGLPASFLVIARLVVSAGGLDHVANVIVNANRGINRMGFYHDKGQPRARVARR